MKQVIPVLLLSVTLLAGCGKSGEKPADESKPPPREFSVQTDTNGNTVVMLNAETQKRIGLEAAPVASAELPPQISAFGAVLDPAPLAALHSELATDQAATENAKKIAQRERTLFAEDENVSRKSVEASEADEKTAEIKLDAARQSLRLSWGDAIAGLGDAEFGQLIDSLASRHAALARVDLMAGAYVSNLPTAGVVSAVGQERWFGAQPLSFAGSVDPRTLGQGIVMRVGEPDALLAPGAAVKALLTIPGEPQRGVLLPESAVVRYEGRAWIYAQNADTNFIRREVSLDSLMPGGWFTTNGPDVGDKIVVTGASILLSEEQTSQTPSAAAD